MKLDRIRYFNDEIAKDTMISRSIESYSIYYYFNNEFHTLDGQSVPEAMAQLLEKTRRKKGVWRENSNKTTYFYSEEFDVVVVADFIKPPWKETQEYFSLAFGNCARHASNAFHAAHDTLTELLNRHSLEQQLDSIISSIVSVNVSDLAGQQQVVGVLAFDIDHFKQVNDTHGHLYGDLVLKSFARRLESFAQRLSEEATVKGDMKFIISRPGGEEFTIVVTGILTDKELCDLADRFREEIARDELPTKQEWQRYEEQGLTTGLSFPPDRERNITCSVGLFSAGLPLSGTATKQMRTGLLNRADLALYKAKTCGRNRVCFFPEIVKKYGRILEVHQDTDIVVIDLGNEVGLKNGQELIVFHPKFDGTTDYIHQDGRTSKRMGAYPRLHSGRIEVIDVQKKISFCRILERIPPNSELVKESWLEAIPLGAIDHLVKSAVNGESISTRSASGPLTPDAVKKKIVDLGAQHPLCAIFRLAHEDTVIADLGTASISKILADLYNALQKRFTWSATIGYVQPTQFALVLPIIKESSISLITESLSEINDHYGGKIRVIAGIFEPSRAEGNYWRDGVVNYSKALELASLISLVPEFTENTTYSVFNESSLHELVSGFEKEREQAQVLEDLKSLTQFGIQAAWLENTIGRIAFGLEDYDIALEAIRNACKLDTNTPIYLANAGLTYYMKNMQVEAYNAFCEAVKLNANAIPIAYYGAWALAADWTNHNGTTVDIEEIISLYDQALENASQLIFCDPAALSKRRGELAETEKLLKQGQAQ